MAVSSYRSTAILHRTYEFGANFPVHRARPMQHDEKTQKGQKGLNVVLSNTDHYRKYRIGVYYTILNTVACQIQDLFHNDMLGIFEEVDHFTPRKLITEDHVPTANLCNFYLCNFYCNFYYLDSQI